MNIFKHSTSLLRKLNTYSIVPKLKQCSFSLHKTLALPKTRTYFLLTFRHQAFTNATFVHHLSSKSGKIFQEKENEYAHKKQLNNTFSTMADQSDHLVFLYGTLKRGAPNYDFIEKRTEGKAVFIGNARTVKKWPLVIASRYNIPYLLYSEGEGKNVTGEIFEVDDIMLSKLDELECHPSYYTRIAEEVHLIAEDGSVKQHIKPWIYFFKYFRSELLDLPCLSDYNSKGSHGLEYVSRYSRPTGVNYYSDVMEIETK